MSFILDALRKSQASRQQQAGPGTIAVEAAPGTRQPHNWWAMVTIIVSLNLAVLVGFIYWAGRDRPVAATPAMVPPESRRILPEPALPPAMTEQKKEGSQASPTLADPRPATAMRGEVRPLSAEVKEARGEAPAGLQGTPNLAQDNQTASEPAAPVILPSPPSDSEYLPTLTELQLDNRISLSPLHVDVHVFNEDPRRRFVLVNARKYKEGERLSEGPLLEAIRRDGLVMYYRGQRFLVPRE